MQDSAAAQIKQINHTNHWLSVLFIALVFSVVLQVIVIWLALTAPKPALRKVFDYPIQTVSNRVEGVRVASEYIDAGPLIVSAEKCNEDSDDILVMTTMSWVSIDPTGIRIQDRVGSQTILSGCGSYDYENRIPTSIAERTKEVLDQFPGLECVRWSVVGIDQPVNRPEIAPEGWSTEPVCLYPPAKKSKD